MLENVPMASARAHTRIARSTDDVWSAVSDATGIAAWFPGVAICTLDGNVRHVATIRAVEVDEEIVTNDAGLRRFQYRLRPGPVPVEHHLATIDVIEDGVGSLVVYSCDVAPDALGPAMQQTLDTVVVGLKRHLEARWSGGE
jgi:Polyketide cyclase / dehydrase and lipid transport